MQNLLELKGISRTKRPLFAARRHACRGAWPDRRLCWCQRCWQNDDDSSCSRAYKARCRRGAPVWGQRCGADAPDELQRHLRSRVGLVLDTCPFSSTLKVGQIESLVGPAYPTWDRETFAGFINLFGLDPKTKVKDLSRGMGMKLQLACALSPTMPSCSFWTKPPRASIPWHARNCLMSCLPLSPTASTARSLSSHITSDLDRTADRVICIDNGAIIFDLPREDITDRAGIAHCTQAQAAELMTCVEGALCRPPRL